MDHPRCDRLSAIGSNFFYRVLSPITLWFIDYCIVHLTRPHDWSDAIGKERMGSVSPMPKRWSTPEATDDIVGSRG